MTKKANGRTTSGAVKYAPATGAPFSEDDAQLIGEELARIAEDNRVDDIRSLDKALVLEAIERDPKHPLRRFYNWNVREAARSHWLEQTRKMINSIRVVTVGRIKLARPQPMFLYVPDHPRRVEGEKTRRGHVVTADVMRDDPAFASSLATQIRQATSIIEKLEHVTSLRATPPAISRLVHSWRQALDDYLGATTEAAAE